MPQVYAYNINQLACIEGVKVWHKDAFKDLSKLEKKPYLVIVQDVFSSCYDLPQMQDILSCLVNMGFKPLVMPIMPSGKPLYVKGFLQAFDRQAAQVVKQLQIVRQQGFELVAVDPSVGLTYRDEYCQRLGAEQVPTVLLLQEWLSRHLDELKLPQGENPEKREVALLGHCSENALVTLNLDVWRTIFAKFSIDLLTPPAGCCGMAGTFGHEQKHRAMSDELYQMSWHQPVQDAINKAGTILATGYSCRSIIRQQTGAQPQHPLTYLNRLFNEIEG
jgi:Fe-S oxidoreductase